MVKHASLDGEVEVEEVRARIDRWRRSRAKRGAMPEELWAEAVALGERFGVYPVCRQLGLSYDRLKLHVVEAELQRIHRLGVGGEQGVGGPEAEVPVGFIELHAAQAFGECGRSGPVVVEVELSRADGSRMSVRMAPEQQLDLVGLSETFFGAVQ